MPLPFLIPAAVAVGGAAINYFGEQQKQDAIDEEMERRRRELDKAKYTQEEIDQGKAGITRTFNTAIDSASNKFAFTSRGIQAPGAKGAMIGEAQGAMISEITDYVNATTGFNKSIDRQKAVTGAAHTSSPILAAGTGALAGLQVGMIAENYLNTMNPGGGMPTLNVQNAEIPVGDEQELLAFGETSLGNEDPFAGATNVEDFVDIGMAGMPSAEDVNDFNSYVTTEGEVVSGAGNESLAMPEKLNTMDIDFPETYAPTYATANTAANRTPMTENKRVTEASALSSNMSSSDDISDAWSWMKTLGEHHENRLSDPMPLINQLGQDMFQNAVQLNQDIEESVQDIWDYFSKQGSKQSRR